MCETGSMLKKTWGLKNLNREPFRTEGSGPLTGKEPGLAEVLDKQRKNVNYGVKLSLFCILMTF